MRILLTALFIIALTLPAFAAVQINLIDNHNGTADITYLVDNPVSGFALDLTVNSGAVITDVFNYFVGESTSESQGYGIFPDSIIIGGDGSIIDSGTPVVGSLGTNSIILEMGAIYEPGNEPPLFGTLCTIRVDISCFGSILPNVVRGGVIYATGTSATLDLSGATNAPITVPEPVTVGLLTLGGLFITLRKS